MTRITKFFHALMPSAKDFLCFCIFMQLFACFAVLVVDRLSLLLAKERSHSQTYLGCMKKGPVFTDPKLKWLVLGCFFLVFCFCDFHVMTLRLASAYDCSLFA